MGMHVKREPATDHALALRPRAEALLAAADALRRPAKGAPDMPEHGVHTASKAPGMYHLPAIDRCRPARR